MQVKIILQYSKLKAMYFVSGTQYANSTIYAIFEYTKTTDIPVNN